MDGETFAAKLWTTGFGNMHDKFSGSNTSNRPQRRALRSDWRTLPMPQDSAEIGLGIPLTAEELDVLSLGHVPKAMEDHWFMYFDGEALCFHRSWTGICVYRVHVRYEGGGYVLAGVTANRDPGQYRSTSDEYDRLVSTALVMEALGRDVSALWEEAFALDDKPCRTDDHDMRPVGFWSADGPLGRCSNWHLTGFDFLGTRFPTAEHWIMWQKARVMGDAASADAILEAPTPKHAKALGGQVGPYDDHLWRNVREQLAYVGVREKFLQNPDAARELRATGGRVLAEASPYDRVWGVGLAATDPAFPDPAKWRGENLQGRVCMRVRADLALVLPDGPPPEHAWRTTEDGVDQVLQSHAGRVSLLGLTRDPITRPYAMCYARIAQHHARDRYQTLRGFLAKAGQATLAEIGDAMVTPRGRDFAVAGWNELLAQLAFLRHVGIM